MGQHEPDPFSVPLSLCPFVPSPFVPLALSPPVPCRAPRHSPQHQLVPREEDLSLTPQRERAYPVPMEIRLEPGLAAKVEELSAETGLSAEQLAEDAFAGHFAELAQVRSMLDSRYDDLVAGRVQGIPGEKAYQILRERLESRRKSA